MKFLELIWEPGPYMDRSPICRTSSWGQPLLWAVGESWKRSWAHKNVEGIWKGKSQESLEAHQLITRKNKTLCLLSITTVVWGIGEDKRCCPQLPFLPWAPWAYSGAKLTTSILAWEVDGEWKSDVCPPGYTFLEGCSKKKNTQTRMIQERCCHMRKKWEPLVGKIRYWEWKTIRAEEETEARKTLALIPLFSCVLCLITGDQIPAQWQKNLLRSADIEESAHALASPVF